MILCVGKMILVGLLWLRECEKMNGNTLSYISLRIRSSCYYASVVLTIFCREDELEALSPPS